MESAETEKGYTVHTCKYTAKHSEKEKKRIPPREQVKIIKLTLDV